MKLPDRVKTKCACDYSLTPMLTRSLIWDNGASRKGMGTDHARRRLNREIMRAYRKWGADFYVGTTDGHHYFESLRHDVIADIVQNTYTDKKLIELFAYWLGLEGKDGVGIGLGNQINQNYAVSYVSQTDHDVSRDIRYIRYMDDAIVIGRTKDDVKSAIAKIGRMYAELGLTLNENKTIIAPAKKGFTFLKMKYRITDGGKLSGAPHKLSTVTARRRIKYFKGQPDIDQNYIDCYFLNYAGRLRNTDARNAVKETATLFFKLYPKTRVRKKGEKYVFD